MAILLEQKDFERHLSMKDLDSVNSLSKSVMASPDLLPVPLKGLFKTSRNACCGGGALSLCTNCCFSRAAVTMRSISLSQMAVPSHFTQAQSSTCASKCLHAHQPHRHLGLGHGPLSPAATAHSTSVSHSHCRL